MAVCEKEHVGDMPDAALKALEDLPESQRGTWRHRCPACAYLAGFRAGEASALEALAGEPPTDPRARALSCPHKRVLVRPGDETFHAQRGCLDCDTWLDPVRLRRP